MATLDFPNSPADGATYSAPNGVTYQWSAGSSRWTVKVASSIPYLPLTGGTLTGNLAINSGALSYQEYGLTSPSVTGGAGFYKYTGNTGAGIYLDSPSNADITLEPSASGPATNLSSITLFGSNSSSQNNRRQFRFINFLGNEASRASINTAGDGLDWTGSQQFAGVVTVAADPTTALGVATKAYTDAKVLAATSQMSAEDNLLINGSMEIWQRGTSGFTASGPNVLTADRWRVFGGAGGTVGVFPVPQPVTSLNRRNAILLQRTTTGSTSSWLAQFIENVRTAEGQTVTLSFDCYSTTASSGLTVSLDRFYGTGGSPSAADNVWTSSSLSTATSWTSNTFTVVVPSLAGKTIGTNGDDSFKLTFFIPTSAGNNSWYFTNIDLRSGSVAPPQFLRRPYQQELALCQRYFQTYSYVVIRGYAAATTPLVNFPLSVRMRTSPSILLNGQTYSNASSASASAVTAESVVFQLTASAAEGYGYFGFTADAEL